MMIIATKLIKIALIITFGAFFRYLWESLRLWFDDFKSVITSSTLASNDLAMFFLTLEWWTFFISILSLLVIFDACVSFLSIFMFTSSRKIKKNIYHSPTTFNFYIFLNKAIYPVSTFLAMLYIFIFSHKFIPYVELILNSAKVTNNASEKYIEDMRFFFTYTFPTFGYVILKSKKKIEKYIEKSKLS
ncbi:hypothetical protein L1D33_06980 [Vibrio chagasii]|uniref:hypothetical protein n=1 Tax=Vibrio TaxID=662 RepID=UPI001493B2CD|nr:MULTISPECIES: hypothetical protein [Vibrio]MCG9560465.1 hypothetical protein [Vibrio chagasii]MCG9673307.1 hypothetical protein [Vibrio chagasii]NOI87985.1 hypothetical protein [Vibrio sp. 99K-1]